MEVGAPRQWDRFLSAEERTASKGRSRRCGTDPANCLSQLIVKFVGVRQPDLVCSVGYLYVVAVWHQIRKLLGWSTRADVLASVYEKCW